MDDAWTPATTHVVIATPSGKRYWDDLATRTPHQDPDDNRHERAVRKLDAGGLNSSHQFTQPQHPAGAPLLDWWEIPDDEGDPMTTRYLVGDVFDRLAEIPDGSVDLVVTSPPFLALRSYLPADHPDKGKEIGSEPTPAAFIDVMLAVTAELRRVLASHGSIAVELGDTYAGSGGGGGDYLEGGWREGQAQFAGSGDSMRESNAAHWRQKNADVNAWPLPKSRTMIPQLYEVALAYGINPLRPEHHPLPSSDRRRIWDGCSCGGWVPTGQPTRVGSQEMWWDHYRASGRLSPAGRWRVRNVVTWCRPNPPVGALGDKWRPATSDVVIACVSGRRYWDDLATRTEHVKPEPQSYWGSAEKGPGNQTKSTDGGEHRMIKPNPAGAPLLDYWVIPPKGYSGAHYAVYPQELVVPLVKAMCPQRVCLTCGEPSRRIVSEPEYVSTSGGRVVNQWEGERAAPGANPAHRSDSGVNSWQVEGGVPGHVVRRHDTLGWTDCGHDNWRTGITLDPFAGSGTTLAVAQGHGRDSVGIDLDERNAELAQGRLGMFLEVEP